MKHRYMHARIARLEAAVAPRMVRIVTMDGSIHFLPCDMIMFQIAHDFDGCSAEVKNILQDAIAPKWLVLSRDTRWASPPVDTDDSADVERYRVNQGKELQ